jgi:hypothetical protein
LEDARPKLEAAVTFFDESGLRQAGEIAISGRTSHAELLRDLGARPHWLLLGEQLEDVEGAVRRRVALPVSTRFRLAS